MPEPTYTVAVRTLCEFAAKQGDLDLRFTPSPTAQQGIAGHQSVVARRPPGYRAELALSGRHRQLCVRGRADGWDPARQCLEEIKTFKGELGAMPANHRALHWAQAKVYAALLCRQLGLAEVEVALVYFDTLRQQEAPPIVQRCSAEELEQFFTALCERFLGWADQEVAHRAQRDAALTALRFPHPDFRSGQRPLAEAVYKAARLGRCLLAQAPTGIGKTVGTLFPLLKACPGQAIDKVFFLTAKGSGRALALGALDLIRRSAPALSLRVIEAVARDKACEHPDKQCHGASCPLARGFYDRLPAAREAAVAVMAAGAVGAQSALSRQGLRQVALAHALCPYYLGQELVRWCDVVVGDYNHWFDSTALLHGLTLAQGWRAAVLVDEAHNLVERARAMYSATLDPAQFGALRAAAPAALKPPLARLQRQWTRLAQSQTLAYQVHDAPPAKFVAALQQASTALGEHLAGLAEVSASAEAIPAAAALDPALLRFHFDALHFLRLLESFGSHSLFDISLDASGRRPLATPCIRNAVPAPFLKPRFAAAQSTTLFSATLTPMQFYADTLGLPEDSAWLTVDAPFESGQLAVRIVRGVSTRFRHRADSLPPIATLIAAQYAERPGNYLAFFSSFDYLQQAVAAFTARHPQVPVWAQDRRLDEAGREAFLARFETDGRGIGFAVLGGSFAEGIDLAGTRLIGAFIATLGLPQFNPVNEALRQRLQAEFGAGHDYTYLYPGLRKVVQAAGRVIRTLSDRGSLHLIDDRFARPEVLRLLPTWWRIETPGGG